MSKLSQHIKDTIEKETSEHAQLLSHYAPHIAYRTGATTWAEKGQKLADFMETSISVISAFTGPSSNNNPTTEQVILRNLVSEIEKRLAEWNQNEKEATNDH